MDVREILQERGSNYGPFLEQARVEQRMKQMFREQDSWKNMISVQKAALDMFAVKISRIICGTPHHKDSWQDIVGYAQLVIDEFEKDGSMLKILGV